MADGSGEVVVVPVTGAANGLNNGAGGTSAQTSNPLSRKLRKILDTRLDNDKVSGAGGAEGRASLGAGVGGWSSVRRPRACPLSSPRGGHPRPAGSPGCVADVGQVRRGKPRRPWKNEGVSRVYLYLFKTVPRRFWVRTANGGRGVLPDPDRCWSCSNGIKKKYI